MSKRITIRDVAQAAGVSISTVHQALNDKPGVSQATREQIRRLSEELGYQPNPMASGLKRRTQHVAVLLPDTSGKNRYYYPPLWQGVRDYLEQVSDWNVECLEFSFPNEVNLASSSAVEAVRTLLREDKLDGLLTVGYLSGLSREDTLRLNKTGAAAMVQIGFENPDLEPLCCVQPDYEVIGRTMAELVFTHIPSFGSVVMCGGNPQWEQHARIVRGFEDYMQENDAHNRVYMDHSWSMSADAQQNILSLLEKPDVAACCSVLSQGSVMLSQGLRQCGKAGQVFAVGSDIFEENLSSLQEGVLNNLVEKNPYAQGYLGIRTLVEYLVQGKRPERHIIYVGSEVVFRSNAVMYTRRRNPGQGF